MKSVFGKFILLSVLLSQPVGEFAQTKTCDVRLNIFLAQETEYPLGSPVKTAGATIVNLSNNKIFSARTINGRPFFSNLSEGKYNVVAFKNGYATTSKPLLLDCLIVDEKNIFDEFVFMKEGNAGQTLEMSATLVNVENSLSPPEPPGGYPKDFKYPEKSLTSYFLNERAIFLPKPKLSSEAVKINEHYKNIRGNFLTRVFVTVDEAGGVTEASYLEDNKFDEKLFPGILETARRAKFIPFKVNGQPLSFSGLIVYTF